MMRVHFRGIVLGVGVLLSVVIVISVFNALDAPPDAENSRHALSAGSEEDAGQSPSRMSPRSSTRLRPQGGARAGRLGGPGARPGGPGAARAGGPGARAGGPAGPGGPRGRMGGAMARGGARAVDGDEEGGDEDEDVNTEIDETPSEDVEEEEPQPRGRAAPRGRMAARPRVRAMDDDDEQLTSGGVSRRGGSKRKSTEDKEEEKEKEKEEEKPTEPPKKEPPYPEWWKLAYPRSAVAGQEENFVGDQPLYPECPNYEAGSPHLKVKRYGFVEPPNFMKNSKNPCWFEWNGKKDLIKCVPFFYIIGAAKCATADLFNRVHGHPSVMMGGSPTYHWWDRLRYGASKTLKYTREAKRGEDVMQLKEYAKLLVGSHGKNLTKELLYSGKSESLFGDASPTYLTENTQWEVMEGNEGCSEPRVIPATFIRHIFPQARIIVMLRDPVERLYSRFLANVPYVYEYENATWALFHTFVAQAVNTYRDCLARMSVRHCAYNTSLFTSAVVRLSEGMYPVFLEDWFRIFPKEQILILKYEEYVDDIQGHLRKIFTHLGIESMDDYNLLKLAELPLVRKGKLRQEAGYMLPETIALLSEFYAPFNLRLAEMLGDDKWLFERNDPPVAAAPAVPAAYAPAAFPSPFSPLAPPPPPPPPLPRPGVPPVAPPPSPEDSNPPAKEEGEDAGPEKRDLNEDENAGEDEEDGVDKEETGGFEQDV